MKIEIRQHLKSSSKNLHDYIQRRLQFSLGRFGDKIRSVTVRVMDLNGPKGGLDKKCQVMAKLNSKTLVMEGVDQDFYVIADVTIERLQRKIAREIDKMNSYRLGFNS